MKENINTLSTRPTVLTIAGLDPSACAGILADIKTLEAHKVNGMSVCTANTRQNVNKFEEPNWIKFDDILSQLNLLQKEKYFDFVKIGLIENFLVLDKIIDELLSQNKSVKIIWDPICKASAQFEFHKNIDQKLLEIICSKLYLVTPNLNEIKLLVPGKITDDACSYLAKFCNILLKGGHSTDNTSTDTLFIQKTIHRFKANKLANFSKRGTGCVLSSAILANLANGQELINACENAKKYITNYLTSNDSQIGYHNYETYK